MAWEMHVLEQQDLARRKWRSVWMPGSHLATENLVYAGTWVTGSTWIYEARFRQSNWAVMTLFGHWNMPGAPQVPAWIQRDDLAGLFGRLEDVSVATGPSWHWMTMSAVKRVFRRSNHWEIEDCTGRFAHGTSER